jgi:peptidyl-prolyl cis-trans isomerase SurA
MALVRRSAKKALGAGLLALGVVGCAGSGSQQALDENRKMDCLTRCGKELEQKQASPPVLVARSQVPAIEELPPVKLGAPTPASTPALPAAPPATGSAPAPAEGIRLPDGITPITPPAAAPTIVPVAGNGPALPPAPSVPGAPAPSAVSRFDAGADVQVQVRIVASIGNNPIYESEVWEMVYQREGELQRLSSDQRAGRQKEIFKEELRKIIDRELVIDELNAQLSRTKQTSAMSKLRDAAAKEAEARLKDFKKERGIPNDEIFKEALRSQGLTMAGIRRQIERGFMMQTFLREKMSSYLDKVGLSEVRDYYAAHPEEFQAEERVKWQDLFVLNERFKSPDEAKQFAAGMARKAANGEDFAKLAETNSMGDSKFRKGAGIGEKPGEIFPADLEPTIMALKQGQVTVKETEAGLHVIRMAERTYAGLRPYDDKLQSEIKRKVQAQIYEREVRRFLDTLWKRTQPQVWAEK